MRLVKQVVPFLVVVGGLFGLMLIVSGCQVNQSDQVDPQGSARPVEIWRK